MQFETFKCPQCGRIAVGVVESVLGLALLEINQVTGSALYEGETRVWWDTQKAVRDSQQMVTMVCSARHEWKSRSPQLQNEIPARQNQNG